MMAMMTQSAEPILIVEDDFDLAQTLIDYLETKGLQCDHAGNGALAYELASTRRYQVIVLDLNLPRMDGFTVCRRLREMAVDTPVIMLTARVSLDDKLAGFESGTDDYLLKPFEVRELLARIKALSHRRSSQVAKLHLGNVTLDKNSTEVRVDNCEVPLAPIEYQLLRILMTSVGTLQDKATLSSAIWDDEPPKTASLKVHVYKLRKTLAQYGATVVIRTVKGQGVLLQKSHEN